MLSILPQEIEKGSRYYFQTNISNHEYMNKGITLIETLVYIALLSLLMVGVISSVYMLIGSEERAASQSEHEQELLLEKYHE